MHPPTKRGAAPCDLAGPQVTGLAVVDNEAGNHVVGVISIRDINRLRKQVRTPAAAAGLVLLLPRCSLCHAATAAVVVLLLLPLWPCLLPR